MTTHRARPVVESLEGRRLLHGTTCPFTLGQGNANVNVGFSETEPQVATLCLPNGKFVTLPAAATGGIFNASNADAPV